MTYDGDAHPAAATVSGVGTEDLGSADDLTYLSGTEPNGLPLTGTPKNAGQYTAVAHFNGNGNYGAARGTKTIRIAPKTLTGSFTAADKDYDGTLSAAATPLPLAGVIGKDDVGLSVTGAQFDTTDAGDGKTVTANLALTGADKGNYVLSSATATAKANITPKLVTGGFTADPKTYDGTTAATISGRSLAGRVTGEGDTVVTLSGGSATFGTASAGPDKKVTGTGFVLAGPGKDNYKLASSTLDTTATINKATLTVSPSPATASRQYSDPNPAFSPKYTGLVNGETASVLGTEPSCSSAATTASAPGSYAISCSGGADGNYAFSFQPGTLTVTAEDAQADYTGSAFVSTGGTSTSKATVNLSATVRDITAVKPADDANGGDIKNATIKFTLKESGQTCSAPIGYVTTGDTKTGTATCSIAVDIGAADSAQYTVDLAIAGYYTAPASPGVVTVSKAIAGMITGGGFLVNRSSAGRTAGASGEKTNFGFNVKPNKSGNTLQGNINTIVRNGGRIYQVKGNSMTSLLTKVGTASTPGTATFEGKASIQDITNPLAPVAVDGNATLRVTMTDAGEPGSNDKIGITVWDKAGGLWFSSNWDGANTQEQLLGGGNVVVR